jgi:hypothetical protein
VAVHSEHRLAFVFVCFSDLVPCHRTVDVLALLSRGAFFLKRQKHRLLEFHDSRRRSNRYWQRRRIYLWVNALNVEMLNHATVTLVLVFFSGKFADEITRELKHTGAGILSMANSGIVISSLVVFDFFVHPPSLLGPNTNGSQVLRQLSSIHFKIVPITKLRLALSIDRSIDQTLLVFHHIGAMSLAGW